MRLLYFAEAFLPVVGGAEIFLDQLARRLVARGHDVTVLAAHKRDMDNRLETPYRLLRFHKPFYRRTFPRYGALHLLRAQRGGPPDVVHAQGAYPSGWAAALYCRWVGRPLVVRPIGFDILPDEKVRSDARTDARVTGALRAAARVVAQSQELEELVAALGVERERIVRIPNAVDVEPFRRTLAARADEPLIAALGIFHRKKGFDILLDAFARVRREVPRARLALAGDGEERAALEQRAAELGLRDAVEFPGLLAGDAKIAFLQRAWVFATSARREPFSNANLEALAAGLPLVATAVGGNREIVVEGANGLLVPPEDPVALAAALVRLLGDDRLRERCARGSVAKAGEYGWERALASYEALYGDLAVGAAAR
jgi:glycosyltransferase involved in cell wall biosynthesis